MLGLDYKFYKHLKNWAPSLWKSLSLKCNQVQSRRALLLSCNHACHAPHAPPPPSGRARASEPARMKGFVSGHRTRIYQTRRSAVAGSRVGKQGRSDIIPR